MIVVALLVALGFMLVIGLVAFTASFCEPPRCTGDALSGFLPCDNYPDCDC